MDSLATTPIELTVPGDSRCLRLARLVASGVATANGLPLPELEDFCIAVDELCVNLIDIGDGEPIHLTFTASDGTLITRGVTRDTDRTVTNQARLALSRQILDAIAESHDLTRANGQAEFRIVTRLRAAGVG